MKDWLVVLYVGLVFLYVLCVVMVVVSYTGQLVVLYAGQLVILYEGLGGSLM